jgi:hypothetical protein
LQRLPLEFPPHYRGRKVMYRCQATTTLMTLSSICSIRLLTMGTWKLSATASYKTPCSKRLSYWKRSLSGGDKTRTTRKRPAPKAIFILAVARYDVLLLWPPHPSHTTQQSPHRTKKPGRDGHCPNPSVLSHQTPQHKRAFPILGPNWRPAKRCHKAMGIQS